MQLHFVDWLILALYVAFALAVGLRFARRASTGVDEFFLSGRTLPWWLAGTSMVATTFAADTPLVITGWVRDHGIWKNWLWWSFAVTTLLGVFLFSRQWRRAMVLTKAELAELRYGGPGAKLLRIFLGVLHSGFTNIIILCWVLLAASKIIDVLFDVDKALALTLACVIALSYSLLAGLWGVVLTDALQFVMAMVGAIALAVLAWNGVGGLAGLLQAGAAGVITGGNSLDEILRFVPKAGTGSPFESAFWTAPVAILAVNLGIGWWATEWADGDGLIVQRVAASRDERHSTLAVLWYAVAYYALRPWPWILVALASLVVLPNLEVTAPSAGQVTAISEDAVSLDLVDGATREVSLRPPGSAEDWHPLVATTGVRVGDAVTDGQALARTDSERAYVVMLARYLPAGLLGLVIASLCAAFMSTIDTHVNLAASYFVNDLYRRFLKPDAEPRHYVWVARIASIAVMGLAATAAYFAESISDLFTFFLAFLGGVGPVYVLRWLWWRIDAVAEIVAMLTSAIVTTAITLIPVRWPLGPLSPENGLLHEGRLLIVVAASLVTVSLSLLLRRPPDPASLVPFYEKVRPIGWWQPVRDLAGTPHATRGFPATLVTGVLSGLALVYGLLFGTGYLLLSQPAAGTLGLLTAALGALGVRFSLRRLPAPQPESSD
ncbi:MAG: sodium:solute symporter family protein [Acidobacteriota bacterium]